MATLKKALSMVNRLYSSKHLLLVNTVTCGALMGLGDVTVQNITRRLDKKQRSHDWHRTGRMFIIGIATGPVNHGWYFLLDRLLPAVTLSTVAKKIILDQIIASPLFMTIFFMGSGPLEGKTLRASWEEMTCKFWGVYKADWTFWPGVQAINFRFVSSNFRVVYVAMATLLWDSFLSFYKHNEGEISTQEIAPAIQSHTYQKLIASQAALTKNSAVAAQTTQGS